MTNNLPRLALAALLMATTLPVSGCNSTGGTSAETRDEISRLNESRERLGRNRQLSPGR